MPPHYNYMPPAGSVVDVNEPNAVWTGAGWTYFGAPYSPPASHSFIGKPGGPFTGWRYDSGQRAWIEPDKPGAAPRPMFMNATPRPSVGLSPVRPPWATPTPAQAAPAPAPAAQPAPAVTVPTTTNQETNSMATTPDNRIALLDSYTKRPWPLLIAAGAEFLANRLAKSRPQPPAFPTDLPEATRQQWLMIYDYNLRNHEDSVNLLRDVAQFVFSMASAGTVIDATKR
jgi:hypothetical protein